MPDMPLNPTQKKLERIDSLLAQAYGRPSVPKTKPLDVLVATILSQNTNDENSGKAYAALRRAFPRWEDVLAADDAAVERAIHSGGLARIKSRRIKKIVAQISERGPLTLDYVRKMSMQDAERELLAFDGVGYKTARCVMLFALGMPAFPVDTHIERILKRIGIVPPESSTDAVHVLMQALTPPDCALTLHLNLIAHGRRICRPRNPQCPACPIRRLCAYGARQKDAAPE